MKLNIWIASAILVLVFQGCNVQEDKSGQVFSCDARSTVAEMCIEEPISLKTQEVSKSTCLTIKGTWSDANGCPSGYKKKCQDGDKVNYYYASSDAGKSCAELVLLLHPPMNSFKIESKNINP